MSQSNFDDTASLMTQSDSIIELDSEPSLEKTAEQVQVDRRESELNEEFFNTSKKVVKVDTHQRDYSEETLAKMMQTPSRPRREKATSLDDTFFSSVDVKRDSITNLDGNFFQEE